MTYQEFIQDILATRQNIKSELIYMEHHHIIPRCLGGTDDENNLIWLTAREHFIAHKLLAEENPTNQKLITAYWCMSHFHPNSNETYCTPEEYEEARTCWHNSRMGHEVSEETKQKQKDNHWDCRGENHPMYGKRHTDSSRKKMSEAKKGKYTDAQWEATANYVANHYVEMRDRLIKINREYRANMTSEDKQNLSLKRKEIWKKKTLEDQELVLSNLAKGVVRKKVLCVDTGEIFDSIKEAGAYYGIDRASISKVCSGLRKTAGSYHWKYYE